MNFTAHKATHHEKLGKYYNLNNIPVPELTSLYYYSNNNDNNNDNDYDIILFCRYIGKPITTYANCDSKMTLYADGEVISTSRNINRAVFAELLGNTKVVGIKVKYPPPSTLHPPPSSLYPSVRQQGCRKSS